MFFWFYRCISGGYSGKAAARIPDRIIRTALKSRIDLHADFCLMRVLLTSSFLIVLCSFYIYDNLEMKNRRKMSNKFPDFLLKFQICC